MKKKLIIYGLGQMFQSYYDEKTKRHLSEKYELVGLIDKNSDLLSNIDLEINLYSFIPKDISFDNICITSEKYYDEIKKRDGWGRNFWGGYLSQVIFCIHIYLIAFSDW